MPPHTATDITLLLRCMERAQHIVDGGEAAEAERFVYDLVEAGEWFLLGRTLCAFGRHLVRALGPWPAVGAVLPREGLPPTIHLGASFLRQEPRPAHWLTLFVLALRQSGALDKLTGVAPPHWTYPAGTLAVALDAQTWAIPRGHATVAPEPRSRAAVALWRTRTLTALLILSDHDDSPESQRDVPAVLSTVAEAPPSHVHPGLLRAALGAVSERLGDDEHPVLRAVAERFAAADVLIA